MLFPSNGFGADPFPALDLPDTTTVKLSNGSTFSFTNTAFVRANFTNITSGRDLYAHFGAGNSSAPVPLQWYLYQESARNFTPPPLPLGAPPIVNASEDNVLVGYLPSSSAQDKQHLLDETAVLSVRSFSIPFDPFGDFRIDRIYADFHNATVAFIQQAKAAGRKKLLVDFQGNGGGQIANLLTLYFNLFARESMPLLFQARAHPQLEWLGLENEKRLRNMTNYKNATTLPLPWTYSLFVKPDGSPFKGFKDWYGPVPGPNGKGLYTKPAVMASAELLNFGEFDHELPWTEPPYKPEDIVIVTDGECASACAIIVDVMVHAHGVKTVALGGRPIEAPMQAIGMVKGGPSGPFLTFPTDFDRSTLPEGVKTVPPQDYLPPLRVPSTGLNIGPSRWGGSFSFNVANGLPVNATEETGSTWLQMLYEPANCKLFYTWEMMTDIKAVWRAVVEVAWGGGKCVRGSTAEGDDTIGGVPKYSEKVEDRYKLGKGPGSLD